MNRFPAQRRPVVLALLLIVGGAVGWYSAFELTLAKIEVLTNPTAQLGCNFSLIVQCGTNLASWQGSVLGFPNPLLGLGGFVAPIAVGVGILAGARFARWFWILFALGMTTALVFVAWLIGQSIFVLGTLCPWCMVVWSVTIPMFWAVALFCLSQGIIPLPARARSFAVSAYGWVPFLSVASYLAIAVIAQVRLDVISYL
jgi:uncharacterized membrane protein